MLNRIRHDADSVNRAGSLHHFPQSLGWVAVVILFFALTNLAIAQHPSTRTSEPAVDSALPDAPQPQNPPAVPPPTPAQVSPPDTPGPSAKPAFGNIRGVIVDRDGAVYQGVRITLSQPASVLVPDQSATSDGDGRFNFTGVPAGPFQITIDASGFATQKITGLLHPGENYEVPGIVLLVTHTTTDVEVTASRFEIAEEELKAEEQQRVFGVIPNFYVVYAPNAPPLTSRQKFRLAWKSWIDPVNIGIDAGIAGIQQANNDYKGYGQGAQGYAKRFGAAYGTDFIGVMLGDAILPSLFRQDPRYFYKGTGSIRSRTLYAISTSVISKSDKGHWQPAYSSILGSMAAGGISNIYYPAADRDGVSLSFENAIFGIAGTAASNLFQEFLVKKLTPKVPNYGSAKP